MAARNRKAATSGPIRTENTVCAGTGPRTATGSSRNHAPVTGSDRSLLVASITEASTASSVPMTTFQTRSRE